MQFFITIGIVTAVVIVLLYNTIKILKEYERGVIFFLGRFQSVKGPGLIILVPMVQRMTKVDLRVIVLDVPTQDVISRDNVSVKVNAVIYFRIVDPEKAIIRVANVFEATSQLSQTTLRSVLGKHELDDMLAEAARTLAQEEQALQLRYLQTLKEIANEKTNTIVFPLPLDLIEPLTSIGKALGKDR